MGRAAPTAWRRKSNAPSSRNIIARTSRSLCVVGVAWSGPGLAITVIESGVGGRWPSSPNGTITSGTLPSLTSKSACSRKTISGTDLSLRTLITARDCWAVPPM